MVRGIIFNSGSCKKFTKGLVGNPSKEFLHSQRVMCIQTAQVPLSMVGGGVVAIDVGGGGGVNLWGGGGVCEVPAVLYRGLA